MYLRPCARNPVAAVGWPLAIESNIQLRHCAAQQSRAGPRYKSHISDYVHEMRATSVRERFGP